MIANRGPATAMSLAFISLVTCCSQESRTISEFQRIASHNEEVVRSFPPTVVWRGEEGYRKERITLQKTSYDVRKTDSLVSPYMGVFEYEVIWTYGAIVADPHAAMLSGADNGSVHTKGQAIYAYQGGQWVKQAHKAWNDYSGDWDTYTVEEVKTKYLNGDYPYLSLFPKLFFALR